MPPVGDFRERLILFTVPTLLLLLGCGVSLVSDNLLARVLTILTIWTTLSVPLAVLIGHCTLSEE